MVVWSGEEREGIKGIVWEGKIWNRKVWLGGCGREGVKRKV